MWVVGAGARVRVCVRVRVRVQVWMQVQVRVRVSVRAIARVEVWVQVRARMWARVRMQVWVQVRVRVEGAAHQWECVDALPLACEMEMVTFKENNVTHTIMLRIVARVGTHTAFCGSALAGRKKNRFCPVCSEPPHMSGWAHGAACVGKGAGGVGEGVGKGAGASVVTGTGAYEGGAHPCV